LFVALTPENKMAEYLKVAPLHVERGKVVFSCPINFFGVREKRKNLYRLKEAKPN
jgi:hypothetical protein